MKNVIVPLTLLVTAWAPPLYATTTDLTANGGFETAGAGGPTDSELFSEFAGGAAGTLSERDSSNPASGSFSHRLLALGADGLGAAAGITQNSVADVGFLSLQEGTSLSATFDADLTLGPGGVAFGQLEVLNGIGAVVASTGAFALTDGAGFVTQTLPTLTVPSFGAAPNDVFAAFLNINVAAGAFDGSSAEAFIDNVSVVGTLTVPEPASLALLSLAGLAMATRQRR